MLNPAATIAEAEAMMVRHEREFRDLMLRQRAEVRAFCRSEFCHVGDPLSGADVCFGGE